METIAEVRNLTRQYRSGGGVKDIEFRLEEGEFFGLLGPNASGKSTTIYLLLGLIRRDEGMVEIFGSDPLMDPTDVFGQVGTLIEDPSFYPRLTARENLEMYHEHRENVDETAITSALEQVGLDSYLHQRVRTFSQGMRQRLGIANALVGDPQFIVLDEPTANLDPDGCDRMLELFQSLNQHQGITFLYCTHRIEQARSLCNRVGFLKDGNLRKTVEMETAFEQFAPNQFRIISRTIRQAEESFERISGIDSWNQSDAVQSQFHVTLSDQSPQRVHRQLVEHGVEVVVFEPEENPLLQMYRDLE